MKTTSLHLLTLTDSLCLSARCVLAGVSDADLNTVLDTLDGSESIFVSGQGRSGLSTRGFAMRLRQMGRRAWVAGETVTPPINDADTLIVCSRSGSTPTTLLHAQTAREIGAAVIAVTEEERSPLAACASATLQLSRNYPDLFLGGTVFELALRLLFDALTDLLRNRWDVGEEDLRSRHANLE